MSLRIKRAIASYKYMSKGAIILNLLKERQAERFGIREGDVIVKIDDVDVDLHTEVSRVLKEGGGGSKPHLLYLWRDGKLVKVTVSGKDAPVEMSSWSADEGGADQARGVAALHGSRDNWAEKKESDLAEAYHRLRAARAHGMKDAQCLLYLATLASYELDATTASEAYHAYARHRRQTPTCAASPTPWRPPAASAARGSRRPTRSGCSSSTASPSRWACITSWRTGSSALVKISPLVRELVNDHAWPPVVEATPKQAFYHDQTRMILWLTDRRYDDALGVWDGRAGDNTGLYDLQPLARAPSRRRHAAAAVAMATERMTAKDPPRPAADARPRGRAVEASLGLRRRRGSGGDDDSADAVLKALAPLGAAGLEERSAARRPWRMSFPPAGKKFREWYDVPFRDRPAKPGRWDALLLLRCRRPARDGERVRRRARGATDAPPNEDYDLAVLTGLMRFGRYDAAGKLIDSVADSFQFLLTEGEAFDQTRRAIAFATEHAEPLKKDWADLRGTSTRCMRMC